MMHHSLVNYLGISWLSVPVVSCSGTMISYHYLIYIYIHCLENIAQYKPNLEKMEYSHPQ